MDALLTLRSRCHLPSRLPEGLAVGLRTGHEHPSLGVSVFYRGEGGKVGHPWPCHQEGTEILHSGALAVRGGCLLSKTWKMTARKTVVAVLYVYLHTALWGGAGSGSAFRGTCMTGQKAKKHKENRQGVLCVRNTPQTRNHADANSGESGWRCSPAVGP